MTWGRAKEPNRLYHNIQKINIPFTVCVEWSTVEKALLDSSVMDNFINNRTTERLGIQTEPLKQPIRLTNIDGTTNEAGRIERYCKMTIQSGHQRHVTCFYETSLGEDQIIFGYPWLRTFNPQIDWEKGKVSMPGLRHGPRGKTSPSPPPNKSRKNIDDTPKCSTRRKPTGSLPNEKKIT